jgi:hypothetical protein
LRSNYCLDGGPEFMSRGSQSSFKNLSLFLH